LVASTPAIGLLFDSRLSEPLDRVMSAVHPAGLSGQTLQRLLDLLASGLLVPGGGSAAGIGGALGVSLLLMVATLPRKGSIPLQSNELKSVIARLRPARDRLVHLAELDVDAYSRVIEALRLPNETPAQHLARHIALQHALRGATDLPLDMMQLCEEALRCGVVVSNHARSGAKADLAIGIDLISVALRGAARAVDANLSRCADEHYVARVTEQCRRFEASGAETINRILRALVPV
jgi:formiminotetrahydrofolate cyclodeaminase